MPLLSSFTKKHFHSVTLKAGQREWYCVVDHKGLLYLEETEPKNYTSCLKDDKFLNFFFKNLRPNESGKNLEFPFVSPCWGEMNYVKAETGYPIVFRELSKENNLIYAGDSAIDFEP